jgi:hypothetical protein
MRLDASYNLYVLKIGVDTDFFDEIMAILVLLDHFPILDAFFKHSSIFLKVGPDRIYADTKHQEIPM